MKNFSLVLILIVFTFNFANAQDNSSDASVLNKYVPVGNDELYLKDDLLLNANFSLNHGTEESLSDGTTNSKIAGFEAIGNLQGGYFIADRVALGLGITLDVLYSDLPNSQENTNVELFGGPFVRYYFVDKLFLQVLGGYGIQNNKFLDSTTIINTNYNGLYAQAALGYDIFLNDNGDVALQLGAGYTYKHLVNAANNTMELTSGKINYNLGIVFYFF